MVSSKTVSAFLPKRATMSKKARIESGLMAKRRLQQLFPQKPLATACMALMLGNTALAGDGQVQGLVSDATGEARFTGAIVRIEELNLETTSQRDGRFNFPPVKPGTYTLTVEYLGAEPVSRQITLADDQTLFETVNIGSDEPILENIIVVGQAAGTNRSLNVQRAADNIITVVSADGIGQFPDTNASEALQRLPGLSIERDQGEGRFVRIRGLGPDFNAVNINGARVPSPDDGRRGVALDVIPSDLLESLEVTKTLTPDQDADSLGGSINVKSLSAFDRDGLHYQFSAEGSYNELESETSPKLAATASNLFSIGDGVDNFGVAGSVSWYERDFGSEGVEADGNWDFDDGAERLEEFEQRDYRIERERLGIALNVDYHPDDNNEYYLRTLHSRYDDTETRFANIVEFDEGRVEGETGAAEIKRELKDRKEEQKISSIILGAVNRIDDWTLEYSVGHSRATEDKPFFIDGAVFESEFDEGIGYVDTREPRLLAGGDVFVAENFELDEIEMGASDTEDKENSVRIDITRDMLWGDNPAMLKFGVKLSRRDKTFDETVWVFEDFDENGIAEDDLLLSRYATGEVDYGRGRFGPGINVSQIEALVDRLPADEFIDAQESTVNDYEMEEDLNAAYIMGRVDIDNWRLLAGFRYESTDFSAQGTGFDETLDAFVPVDTDHDYSKVLPSIHVRYKLTDKTIIRAAWTHSLVRPSFEQLAPGFLIEEDDGEIEASFGNPELEALESANFDVGIEHYFGTIGVVSAMAFYKDIENFIFEADLAGTGRFENFEQAETFINGDDAELYGIELNYAKQFSELPEPWNGLLLTANATFSDSEATIEWFDDGERFERDITLPSQSDTTANLALGYENHWLSLRLSATYKDDYLIEVDELDDSAFDRFEDDHLQIDFTAKAFVAEGVQVYFKAINLNDEPFYAYSGRSRFNAQYEEYGPTYQLGVQLTAL